MGSQAGLHLPGQAPHVLHPQPLRELLAEALVVAQLEVDRQLVGPGGEAEVGDAADGADEDGQAREEHSQEEGHLGTGEVRLGLRKTLPKAWLVSLVASFSIG